jgi:tetratricopeptide (TPR) repeat protein
MTRLHEPGDRLEKWVVTGRHMGSWAVVYVLRQLNYGSGIARPEIVVGKTLRPEFAADAERVARFEEECYAWLTLGGYKHIVRLFSVDRLDGRPFAIAEYLPDVPLPNTLRGWMDHGIVELESALRFAVHIVRGLNFARSRGLLVHQDLKPENVMITSGGVAKVTDWGLSRMRPATVIAPPAAGAAPFRPFDVPRSGPEGTRGYAAPELFGREATPTARSDVFSLVVLFGEMLSGRLPGPGAAAAEFEPWLRPLETPSRTALAELLAACLAERPADRPTSVADLEGPLAAAFEELIGVPVDRDPGPPTEAPTDLTQRGYGLFMLGRLDEAFELHRQVFARLDEGELGGIWMDYKEHGWKLVMPQERLAEVEREARRALDDPALLDWATALLLVAGSLDRALDLCREWLRRHPADGEALSRTAAVLAEMGDWPGAIDHLDRALARMQDAELWLTRSRYCSAAGDEDGALTSAEQAVRLDPGDAQAHIVVGHIRAERGHHRRAAASFRAAVQAAPDNALAWYDLGVALRAEDDRDEARYAMLRAVEIDPEYAYALNALGGMEVQAGRTHAATEYWLRAIAADPHYARPWFNLGQVYEQTDQIAKARHAYQRALEIDPGHPRARIHLDRLDPLRRGGDDLPRAGDDGAHGEATQEGRAR